MKFLPGDTYIYDTVAEFQRIVIRSEDDRWFSIPSQGPDSIMTIFDEDMERIFKLSYRPDLGDRAVFVRRGVDIHNDVLLGYADNIQF